METRINLIEELNNYCDINNPVGALMLSGEWGCGKTYFIKIYPVSKRNICFCECQFIWHRLFR